VRALGTGFGAYRAVDIFAPAGQPDQSDNHDQRAEHDNSNDH
jgi:hypothetical protein